MTRFNNGNFESIEQSTTVSQTLLGLVVFTLPAAGALWYTRRTGPQGVVLGLLLAAIPVAMAIVVGALGVVLNFRHYSFAVPGYYLAVAIGWRVCFQNTASRVAWLAIVAGISAFALRANYFVVTKPDYRAGFLPLAQSYRSGDCVTTRPRAWRNQVHFAWEVYYRDRGTLRLVPFDALSTASTACERLWVVWDRTWWMNLDQDAAKRSDEALAKLEEHFKVVERYDHPAIDAPVVRATALRDFGYNRTIGERDALVRSSQKEEPRSDGLLHSRARKEPCQNPPPTIARMRQPSNCRSGRRRR